MRLTIYLFAIIFLVYSDFSISSSKITTKFYEVSGKNAKDLHDAITVNSPIGSSGLTELKPGKSDFEFEKNTDGKYVFIIAIINQEIIITLPKWNDRSGAKKCVIDQWEKAMIALKTHENNHAKKYQELEVRFNKRASKIPPQESKEQLTKKLQGLLNQISADIKREQKKYDSETNFGQKEGVMLSNC